MTKRLDIWLISVLCLLLAGVAGSCTGNDEPVIPETPTTGERVCFKFKIYTDKPAARSRAMGVWEEDAATIGERILDAEDIRVMILNTNGTLRKAVRPTVIEQPITGDGYYDLTVTFEDEELDKKEDSDVFNFGVVILANVNSIGGLYTTDGLFPGAGFDELDETFVMKPEWYPTEAKGIPMYGYLSGLQATKAQMTSEGGYRVEGEIPMLRAMCKIEVADGIESKYTASDGNIYPRVTSVKMVSWRDKGLLRPADLGYATPGTLTKANIPDRDAPATTTTVTATQTSVMFDGTAYDNGFRMYCPEAKRDEISFIISAELSPGETKEYTVSLSEDKFANKAEIGTELVRNHIYRFKVNSLNTATANIDVIVADWTVKVDEYDVDYNVVSMGPDGFLKWEEKANFAVDADTKQLSILNGTTDYATGTFHIDTPKGTKWRAYFIPGENGVDAFEFVDVDAGGNVVEGSARGYAEGNVGEPSTIHVRGKGAADAYRHYAELVVEVRTVDGRVLFAPLASADKTRITIYRENRL